MRVTSNIVLVEPLDEVLEESKLILVPGADEKTKVGLVRKVGPGKKNEKTGLRQPIYVQEGDKVLYGRYTGEELCMHLNGIDLLAIREPDIMALIVDEPSC
jgi:chaperonin GroES